jgi:hypothetical protein
VGPGRSSSPLPAMSRPLLLTSPCDAAAFPSPFSSTRAATDPFSQIPALLPTPIRFYATAGGGVARAVTSAGTSASNAAEVTAVLCVAGGARETGALLLKGLDLKATSHGCRHAITVAAIPASSCSSAQPPDPCPPPVSTASPGPPPWPWPP